MCTDLARGSACEFPIWSSYATGWCPCCSSIWPIPRMRIPRTWPRRSSAPAPPMNSKGSCLMCCRNCSKAGIRFRPPTADHVPGERLPAAETRFALVHEGLGGFAMILGEPGVHVMGHFQVHALTQLARYGPVQILLHIPERDRWPSRQPTSPVHDFPLEVFE